MLIRGQTTEDRIKEIAQGFGQGFQNFQQGQDRQRARALQDEALRRQQAMDELAMQDRQENRAIQNKRIELDERINNAKLMELSLPFEETREYKKASAIEALKRQNKPEQMSYEQKLDLKMQKEREAKATERQSPEYKLEKLGAEGRSKVGALASGLQAIDQMDKASADGYGPEYINANTSVIGGLVSDTPYSEAERMTSEVIGRLQSGGAIQAEEIKTFRSLGPRPGDDAPTRKRKLAQQRDFLQNKLTAFGVSNDDLGTLGFKTSSDYVARNPVTQAVNTQQAAPSGPPKTVIQNGFTYTFNPKTGQYE